ncbi:Rpp20 subunit of nuclear RNase MRP and P-domain-containing protein [Cercophora scortea]|uniref:Rpp20 subunit of nuclear RNase MRP and P-domain-containing protein n=1 Tax=Cercophora scortea TaxID=314031 RepID=A0AAE0J6C5_9PEZI|nr:Rpp20 subunit of nuclear RNase MRP and P-domain-containing protein [Cercophora scortea]
MNTPESARLPNRPETKLPPLPKGTRIHKRPLPPPSTLRQSQKSYSRNLPACYDLDGYQMPPRASHTHALRVTSSAPFMSLVKRVRKALDSVPQRQRTKGLPLTARIAAMEVQKDGKGQDMVVQDALDDVVLIATGKAIEKAVNVGGFFMRERDLVVALRTRTVGTIDDLVAADEDGDGDLEDEVRVRQVSCLEVGIRWRGT